MKNINVLMLVSNNLARDARVRKEAQTVAAQGFELTVIGLGTVIPEDLEDAPYRLILSTRRIGNGKLLIPKWGRENIWYPLRVLVNRTVTAWRIRRWNTECIDSSPFPAAIAQPGMEMLGIEQNPDIVHCHDLDTLWAGYRIAQQCGALLVYDSHELYLALHYLREDAREQYAQVEARVFPQLDALITVSPAIGRALTERYQSDLDPVILYNGGTHVADSAKPVSCPVKLFFQGAFASDRNNVELVSAMQYLQGRATLTLQGWGADETELRNTIAKLSLEDTVSIIAPVPPLEVVDSANNYDVGVINYIGEVDSIPVNENFTHTLPNKLFDYMCGGLAIASTSITPINEIVEAGKCGITFEQLGVKHTADVLGELVSDPQHIQRMKEASLAAAPQYAWPAQAEKLAALYEELASKVKKDPVQNQTVQKQKAIV